MIKLLANICSVLADSDFENNEYYDNFDQQVNFSATISVIIGIISALIFLTIFITAITIIVKNRKKIADAGKDMLGAIQETINSATNNNFSNTKEPEAEYTNCTYCGSSVNVKSHKCPNCGASIKRNNK